MSVRFTLGIDLGTSNCAVASVEHAGAAAAKVVDLPIPQLARPGELADRPLLPSCVYLPSDAEFPAGALSLPWGEPPRVTGELARWQGARVPGRLVASAKSWLCHPAVDRQAPILPWGAPAEIPRISPVEASAELLRHIAHAWNSKHPDAQLADQEVVLTVPASFDEAARALTLTAAKDAGYPVSRLLLLEEPQAAFYDFTSRHRDALAKALAGIRLVLVVDVGGGTTDFSLVQTAMLPEGPALKRIAVGDHLLLGGDNMDAALAHLAEKKALGPERRFSGAQWTQATQACRAAKEALLGSASLEKHAVSIAAAGSRLLGGTVSTELTREEIESLVIDGFFPRVSADDAPRTGARAAIVELGLPFAQDAAITRHLVAFLRAHADAGRAALGMEGSALPRPDAILLNGGVFNSPRLTRALVETVSALWPNEKQIPLLAHDSLDLAVARGAAYSGLARRALGKKIGGGAPRAYYAAVSSTDGSKHGVCLIPRGLEEGDAVELKDRTFQLTLGTPVQFQLFSTTADRIDKPGDLVPLEGLRGQTPEEGGFNALPPIHTILSGAKGTQVQVHLHATLTEVGTLALSCVAGAERWRLEFELRGAARQGALVVTESMPARFSEAVLQVEKVFGNKPLPVGPKDVKNLARTLEQVLGPRDHWKLPVLRELWTALFSGAAKRRRSPDHERVLFHLLGYSLRPGVGYPLDAWRCEQTFTLFKELITHHQDAPVWAEFWILWRRIAGGLNQQAQEQLWNYLAPHLERKVPLEPTVKDKLKGVQPQGLEEMVRCAASLELISPANKAQLGLWIGSRLEDPGTLGGPWAWALGRLGARVPVNGATHRVVSVEQANTWLVMVLELPLKRVDGALFALAQIARRTGDRSRDVDPEIRAQVAATLKRFEAPATWVEMVENVVQLSAADEARALGDTLPAGLSL